MASGLSSSKNIEIVVAVIADANGRILMVRKRDTKALIHPGGKRRPGERALDTLARELREELGVELLRPSVRRLGLFEERAANEPGRRVCAEAFAAKIAGTPRPQAEITELLWIDPRRPPQNIAPMSRRHILPAWRQAR